MGGSQPQDYVDTLWPSILGLLGSRFFLQNVLKGTRLRVFSDLSFLLQL